MSILLRMAELRQQLGAYKNRGPINNDRRRAVFLYDTLRKEPQYRLIDLLRLIYNPRRWWAYRPGKAHGFKLKEYAYDSLPSILKEIARRSSSSHGELSCDTIWFGYLKNLIEPEVEEAQRIINRTPLPEVSGALFNKVLRKLGFPSLRQRDLMLFFKPYDGLETNYRFYMREGEAVKKLRLYQRDIGNTLQWLMDLGVGFRGIPPQFACEVPKLRNKVTKFHFPPLNHTLDYPEGFHGLTPKQLDAVELELPF